MVFPAVFCANQNLLFFTGSWTIAICDNFDQNMYLKPNYDIYQLKDATKGRSLQLQSHSGAIFLNVIFSKVSRHKLPITDK